jgi:hypothetical protein
MVRGRYRSRIDCSSAASAGGCARGAQSAPPCGVGGGTGDPARQLPPVLAHGDDRFVLHGGGHLGTGDDRRCRRGEQPGAGGGDERRSRAGVTVGEGLGEGVQRLVGEQLGPFGRLPAGGRSGRKAVAGPDEAVEEPQVVGQRAIRHPGTLGGV